MNKNFSVRVAENTDIEVLIELLRQLFSIEEDFVFDAGKQRAGLELMMRDCNSRRIFVAEAENKVIGMISGQTLVSTAEGGLSVLVEDVVVDEKYRRAGIGKALLKRLDSWAAEKGAKRMQLLADLGNNKALDFYRSLNWAGTKLICLQKKGV